MMSPTTAIVTTNSPPAQPLDRAEHDQLGHVLADAAERRADEEDHNRRLQHDLPSVQVAELPIERTDNGRGEQIRRDDPRELRDTAEVADDRRQRRGNDRLIQRREQQHQQQRSEDQTHRLPLADAGRGRGFGAHLHGFHQVR
jgi:hypothetical protein